MDKNDINDYIDKIIDEKIEEYKKNKPNKDNGKFKFYFFTFSSIINKLNFDNNKFCYENPIQLNFVDKDKYDKNVYIEAGSCINFAISTDQTYGIDYPVREIHIYSSCSKTFNEKGKQTSICGVFTQDAMPNDPESTLGGGLWNLVPVTNMYNRFGFKAKNDIYLGKCTDVLNIAFLVRAQPLAYFQRPPSRPVNFDFLGDHFMDEYYLLNFKFGSWKSKVVSTLTYWNKSEIVFNIKFKYK